MLCASVRDRAKRHISRRATAQRQRLLRAMPDRIRGMNSTMSKATKHRPGDFVVYPAHGVGQIKAIQDQEIAGEQLEFLVVEFEREKMTLRIPTTKVEAAGLRSLATKKDMQAALKTLAGKVRVRRAMWSRRAQEYEAKINSGDPIAIAEVVRDLYRGEDQPDQSYSERQIYQSALERLTRELAIVEKIDEEAAEEKVVSHIKTAAAATAAAAAAATAAA